jgi:hypothetical protein
MNGGEPLLERREKRARTDVLALIRGSGDGLRQLSDRALQFRIVRRHSDRRSVLRHGVRGVAATPVHVAKRTNGREILGRALKDGFELLLRGVELVEVQQGPAERYARGKIRGMSGEAAAAHIDGFLMLAQATALFGELRKRNRRRIVFDPASKVFQSDAVRHAVPEGRGYLVTTTVLKTLELRPTSSVTPRTTV